MSFFGGGSSSSTPSPSQPAQSSVDTKNAIIDNIRREMAVNTAQTLIDGINRNCFERCVPSPGAKLDNTEQTCVSRCMDKYMETWNMVSRAYVARVTKESSATNITTGGVSY